MIQLKSDNGSYIMNEKLWQDSLVSTISGIIRLTL